MTPYQPRDWKFLAEQASREMDSDKLLGLVIELNRVLGEREESIQWQQRQWNKPWVLSRWRLPSSWFVIARNSPNQSSPSMACGYFVAVWAYNAL
jgi:hypothetical protein